MKKFNLRSPSIFLLLLGLLYPELPVGAQVSGQPQPTQHTKSKKKKKKKGKKTKLAQQPKTGKKHKKKKYKKRAPVALARASVEAQPLSQEEKNQVLDTEIALFNNTTQSTLLTQAQKNYVANNLLPILLSERGGTQAPSLAPNARGQTAQTPSLIAILQSINQKIASLITFLSTQQPQDAATQSAYQQTLEQLTIQANQMDQQLQQLMGQTTQGSNINSTPMFQ